MLSCNGLEWNWVYDTKGGHHWTPDSWPWAQRALAWNGGTDICPEAQRFLKGLWSIKVEILHSVWWVHWWLPQIEDPAEALKCLHFHTPFIQVTHNMNPLSTEQSQNLGRHLSDNLVGHGKTKREGQKISNADRPLQKADISEEVKRWECTSKHTRCLLRQENPQERWRQWRYWLKSLGSWEP